MYRKTSEETPLNENPNKSIIKDGVLALTTILICMAEGVEVYLPGTISQEISCDLNLSHTETGLVECSIYFGSTVAGLACSRIVTRLGNRLPLLASCYLSIISTFVSAFSYNLVALIVARIFIGLCTGVCLTTNGLFMSERIINRNLYEWMAFITSTAFCFGAGWVALLAQLFLKALGWQYFLLITSVPLFIPPIVILHTVFPESSGGSERNTDKDNKLIEIKEDKSSIISLVTFSKLTYLTAVLSLASEIHAGSTVIFLPHLIKRYNTATVGSSSDPSSCKTNIHGNQFLTLIAVNFGAVLGGKLTGYWLYTRVTFKYSLFLAGLFSSASYSAFLVTYDIRWIVIAFGVIKFIFGICSCQLRLIKYDSSLFREGELIRSCSVITSAVQLGLLSGAVLTGFTAPLVTTIVCLIAGLTEFTLGFFMKLEKLS